MKVEMCLLCVLIHFTIVKDSDQSVQLWSLVSLYKLGATIGHQLRWQANSGPTACAGWIKTRIRLCSLVIKQATIGAPAKRHLNAGWLAG